MGDDNYYALPIQRHSQFELVKQFELYWTFAI